ncbi:MAG: hypothetical protein IJD01_05795 [Clostridia bacterium]|nr:hypothetical protein [Clostridia bacterium]
MENLIELFYKDEEAFDEALDAIEVNRPNAEELMELTDCYDIPSLFKRLLEDFDEVLTEEEATELRRRYDERFDMPL